MNDPAAQAFMNASRQIEAGRQPVWNGTADSAFTAEQWTQCIQKVATAEGLMDPVIMSNVFNALCGNAQVWYDALPTIWYNLAYWEDFIMAFLRTNRTVCTVRTTALNITDIKQGASEGININIIFGK